MYVQRSRNEDYEYELLKVCSKWYISIIKETIIHVIQPQKGHGAETRINKIDWGTENQYSIDILAKILWHSNWQNDRQT